jgi:hypothetical protein
MLAVDMMGWRGEYGRGASHLLSAVDQTLLHWWNAFLLLNLFLDLRYLNRRTWSESCRYSIVK